MRFTDEYREAIIDRCRLFTAGIFDRAIEGVMKTWSVSADEIETLLLRAPASVATGMVLHFVRAYDAGTTKHGQAGSTGRRVGNGFVRNSGTFSWLRRQGIPLNPTVPIVPYGGGEVLPLGNGGYQHINHSTDI